MLEEGQGLQRLDYLRDLDPPVLWRYLQNELPQTIAVVLSYLSPQKTAALLMLMPEELRAEIVARMALSGSPSPGALEAMADGVRELTHTLLARDTHGEAATPQFIADVISNMEMRAQKAVLEALRQRSPELAQEVDELVFTFEDVLKLDDRSLQLVLRNLDSKTIALALKNVSDAARERILSNMSSRAREAILQELELLGQVRVRDVRLVNLGDKGLSVGEASRLTGEGIAIENVDFGVVSKDLSRVTVSGVTIAAARIAGLAAYVKKPAYGPASITADGVTFVDVPVERQTLVQTGSWIDLDGARIWGSDVDIEALYEKWRR